METLITAEEKSFQINETTIGFLAEIAKWAKFLAVIGYIFIGFMVIVSIIVGLFLPSLNNEILANGGSATGVNSTLLTSIYLIMAAIYVYPVYALYSFASGTQKLIKNNDENELENSFKKLKGFFKYFGILTIVALAFYVLIIIAAIFAGVASAFL
jgi:hypothetical protein